MSVVRIRWGRYPVGDHGRWLWVPAFAGTTEDGWGPNEFAATGKPLALDACRQCRRADRGLLAQDLAAALRSLRPPAGRLSFRLHQARPDRRDRLAVYGQGAGVAGVRAQRHGVADHG